MMPRDKAIIDFIKSRKGIVTICLALTVCGMIFILVTGRYELTFFVVAGLLPWIEYWYRRRQR